MPKKEDSIEQIEWVFRSPIYFDFQRPSKIRLYGYEFNACGVVGDWVGDEDCFYIWSAHLFVRSATVFCGVRYDIAYRKIGTFPTYLVLELIQAVHPKNLAQRRLVLALDPIGYMPCCDREINRRVHLIRPTFSVQFGLLESTLFIS